VINITNITCQDNPPWPPAGPARKPAGEPAGKLADPPRRSGGRFADIAGLTGLAHIAGLARLARLAGLARLAAAVLLSWLAYILRRLGDRLFSWNDTEAYWRGWQITKVHGGLGRRYRDPRFDTLTGCPQCLGGRTSTMDTPCAPCLGTGCISTEEVS